MTAAILNTGGTLCMGIVLAILMLYLLVSRIEGASGQGEGIIFVLLGAGPLAMGLMLYYIAWQISISQPLF